MAQLVLTVAGYAIGSYFGYPQLGTIVGSLVGAEVAQSMLPDSTTAGPRLEDRKVQTSAYGANIPYLFGTQRVAGNVIWAEDLEEVESITTTGGKGGPTFTSITYTYFDTFATLLSFGPCMGVRRIWGDQVLIFDGTVDPPVGFSDFAFYSGTDDQLPDPTMEAALGVGNAPGYRGYCYLVFNRLPLEQFGNRIPSITVELEADGTFEAVGTPLGTAPTGDFYTIRFIDATQRADGQVLAITYPNATSPATSLGVKFWVYDQFTGLPLLTLYRDDITGSTAAEDRNILAYAPGGDEVWLSITGAKIMRFNAQTFAYLSTVTLFAGTAKMTWEPASRRMYFRPNAAWLLAGGATVVMAAGVTLFDVLRIKSNDPSLPTDCGTIGLDGTVCYESDVAIISTITPSSGAGDVSSAEGSCGAWDPLRKRYVLFTGRIWTVTDADPPVIVVQDMPDAGLGAWGPDTANYDSGTDSFILASEVTGLVDVVILDAETFALLFTSNSTLDFVIHLGVTLGFPAGPGSLLMLGSWQPWRLDFFGTTVGAAVERLCLESGMSAGDINVSQLGQYLRGYLMSSMGPARGVIEQLGTAYLFEAVEQDDVLFFRKRGGAVVATVTTDDCGAAADTAQAFPISRVRAQEGDLPRKIFVTAPDPYTDYQPGTQYGERRAIAAGDDEQIQLAVVLNVDEARQLADAQLFDRWASRNQRSWATGRRQALIVPADPIILDGERVRVLTRDDDGQVIRWTGVTDDPDVVNQYVLGVQGSFTGQIVTILVPSEMMMVDTALLRDADNTPGAYVAVYGARPYWRGALVFASDDAGASWSSVATVPQPGISIGSALDALPDFLGGFIFDEVSTVRVAMFNGAPSSVTRAQVLSGSNGAAIRSGSGWEIIQYRSAVIQTDGSYLLSGLLRGQRGTGFAIAGHAIGDAVVLLDELFLRTINIEAGKIGVSRAYKPVSIGDTLDNTIEVDSTISAERLKPWSPVDLRAARDIGSGDITFTWKRRTRLSTRFVGAGGISVPLGEDSEAYALEVYANDTYASLLRTISGLSTASAPYSAADQTGDGFTPGDPIPVRVYQISATVGRGHPLEAQR